MLLDKMHFKQLRKKTTFSQHGHSHSVTALHYRFKQDNLLRQFSVSHKLAVLLWQGGICGCNFMAALCFSDVSCDPRDRYPKLLI